MHKLIAAPFLDEGHLILRPGSEQGMRIPARHYDELLDLSACDGAVPYWLSSAAFAGWGIDLTDPPLNEVVNVRQPGLLGYGRATWELNLGCNYDCEHCYLGLKLFEGMGWDQRVQMLHVLRDAGVVWLQMTGGEPLVDKLFADSYRYAWDLGMMISITISIYGATAASYDALVRRKGAFDKFRRGITAAADAGLPMNFNLLATTSNDTELAGMRALADGLGLPYHVFSNMAPTIQGDANPLAVQSIPLIAKRKPFTGCNAGHTFFHVDPHGKASVCKIGRDPNIDLLAEGVEGLRRLGSIADGLLTRQGGCTGCGVQGTCGTCMPLVQLYRKARSPMERYCQHRENGEVIINGTDSDAHASTDAGTRHDLAATRTAG